MKLSRRPLLDHVYNPQGVQRTVEDLQRRAQRVERAPVKHPIIITEPKKKKLVPPKRIISNPTLGCWWELDIVMGRFPTLEIGAEADYTFSLNEKTYTFHWERSIAGYSGGWVDSLDPASDPPSGFTGFVLAFNSPERGHQYYFGMQGQIVFAEAALHIESPIADSWYELLEPRLDIEARLGPPIVVDHGTWTIANTNGNDTPFDGQDIGMIQTYLLEGDPLIYIEDLIHMDQSFIFPFDREGTTPP